MKSKFFMAVVFAAAFFSSCKNESSTVNAREKNLHKSSMDVYAFISNNEKAKSEAIESYIEGLSIDERLSQIFLLNLEGCEYYTPVEYVGEKPLIPGGYIFFSFNIAKTPEKIIDFTDSIKQYCYDNNSVMPFLSIDVEGGYVNRLRGIAGELPENLRVAECLTPELAARLYSLNARQLKALGFSMNLAPVSEVCTDENATFLDGRSYGSKESVSKYASVSVASYESEGVGTVVKHFPGNSNVDPHKGLPVISYSQESFRQNVLAVFSEVLKSGASGILMSHAIINVPGYEFGGRPSCLSEPCINGLLKNTMGYDGIVFSDDIFMAALEKNGYTPEIAISQAISAGVDSIMLSEKRFKKELEIVKNLYNSDAEIANRIDDSVRKIIKWKINKEILKLSFESGKWHVNGKITLPDKEARLNDFYKSRMENSEIYKNYFSATADRNELHAVRWN